MSSSNKGLILFAHGSRRAASNEEIIAMADSIAASHADVFSRVEAAFLEQTKPDLLSVIDQMNCQEISELTVMPLFVTRGVHIEHDLPELVKSAQQKYPGLKIKVLPHLLALPGLQEFITAKID